jgi:shikimate kinase
MKIILLGYMGSGKSTVAKALQNTFKIDALDLDDYIIEKEGISISQIFATKGEIYFRKQENIYLQQLLESEKSFILALGGGTPCYANNIEFIKTEAKSFYLKGKIDTLFQRLRQENSSRPLISELNDEKLKEFIAKHLFERAPFYEQANHIISIDDKSVETIASDIEALV